MIPIPFGIPFSSSSKALLTEFMQHLTPIIMNLTEKLATLKDELKDLERDKEFAHQRMKEVREKIRKYERVLKEAQEIESVEEKPLV